MVFFTPLIPGCRNLQCKRQIVCTHSKHKHGDLFCKSIASITWTKWGILVEFRSWAATPASTIFVETYLGSAQSSETLDNARKITLNLLKIRPWPTCGITSQFRWLHKATGWVVSSNWKTEKKILWTLRYSAKVILLHIYTVLRKISAIPVSAAPCDKL